MTRVLCPRCETNSFTPVGEPLEPGTSYPAWSRTDRDGDPDRPLGELLWVCSECGTREAMTNFATASLIEAAGGLN